MYGSPEETSASPDDEGTEDDAAEFERIDKIAERITSIWRSTSNATGEARVPPDVSHLDDAVELIDDTTLAFLIEPGETVLIERYIHPPLVPTQMWLDTRLYTVVSVDQETGRLELYDEGLHQMALSNFIDGMARGYSFKVPTSGLAGVKKRRGGRKKKNLHRK